VGFAGCLRDHAVASFIYLQPLGIPGVGVLVGILVAILGMGLIWFAEPLGEISSFSRGIPHTSPPLMIEIFGWMLLVGYPVVLFCVLRWAASTV